MVSQPQVAACCAWPCLSVCVCVAVVVVVANQFSVADAAATSRLQEFPPPAPGGSAGGYRPPDAPAPAGI